MSAATRSPAWDSFSRIIDIICIMQVMSPPIMSQPFTMSSSFISPPIMGVVWADAANAANAIAAAMERPDKGRETWTFMTMLLVNFPLGVPGSSR